MAIARGVWNEEYEVPDPVETPETPVVETPTDVVETPVVETLEAVVETPVVETPVEEAPVVETPVVETAEAKEVIKEVEKIVEKYPEMDEHTKELFDALLNKEYGKVANFLTESQKDFATMSDYDVVKEKLQKANPTWDKDDVAFKMNELYGDTFEKYDLSVIDQKENPVEYEESADHNKRIERYERLLKIDAKDARVALDAAKKELKFPKTETPVVETVAQPTPEELQKLTDDWNASVDTAIPNLSEFKFTVDGGDVNYKVTDAERKEQAEFMKTLTPGNLAVELGWVDKDGKQDIAKIAGDVLKLKKMNQLIASAYKQGKTAGTKATAEEIKNIDLGKNSNSSVESTPPDIGLEVWGNINPK